MARMKLLQKKRLYFSLKFFFYFFVICSFTNFERWKAWTFNPSYLLQLAPAQHAKHPAGNREWTILFSSFFLKMLPNKPNLSLFFNINETHLSLLLTSAPGNFFVFCFLNMKKAFWCQYFLSNETHISRPFSDLGYAVYMMQIPLCASSKHSTIHLENSSWVVLIGKTGESCDQKM